jgi:hypothetical protein
MRIARAVAPRLPALATHLLRGAQRMAGERKDGLGNSTGIGNTLESVFHSDKAVLTVSRR